MSACVDCQTPNNTSPGPEAGQPGVTYDEGQGVKNRVVISGPLSEVLAKELNIIFQKTPLDLGDGAANAPLLEAMSNSKESYAQDVALQAAFREALLKPENEVVLRSVDVTSIKDHVARMHEGEATNEDLQGTQQVNVVAGDIDHLLNGPEMSPYDINEHTEIILMARPVTGDTNGNTDDTVVVKNGPSSSNRIMQLLQGRVKVTAPQGDYPTVTSKVEALERIYTGNRVHASKEAFVLSMIERLKAK